MTTTAGDRLRAEGQDQATHAADPRILLTVDKVIADAINSGERFSANTIRDRLPVTSRGLVGARVDSARKRGLIEAVGFEPSTLPSTRGHRILIWQRSEQGTSLLIVALILSTLVPLFALAAVALGSLTDVAGALR